MDGNITFTINGLDGNPRTYYLKPILHKDAIWVMDKCLRSVITAVGSGLDAIALAAAGPGGIMKSDAVAIVSALQPAINALDFEDMWKMMSLLFQGATIRSGSEKPLIGDLCVVQIKRFDVEGAGYFREHPMEMYVALFQAIHKNWPSVFTLLLERIRAFMQRLEEARKKSQEQTESNGQCQTKDSTISGSNVSGVSGPVKA